MILGLHRVFLALMVPLMGCSAVDVSVGALSADAGVDEAGDGHHDAATDEPPEEGTRALYLEAESAALSGGFVVVDDRAASAGQLLAAPSNVPAESDATPGAARARYKFELARAGDYVIWGRIRARDALHNRFWFSLDGAPFVKWRISVGDIWYWDDLHDNTDYGNALHFALEAGAHELVLADAVAGVELDRLYITDEGDKPPGNTTLCSPPHSIEVMSVCLPSCGAQRGRSCDPAVCAGKSIIEAYDCAVCCSVP